MYRILGSDGKEYGPVSAGLVRQWIAERRLNRQSQIKMEGEVEWKSLGEFTEFAAGGGGGSDVPPAIPSAQIRPAATVGSQPRTGLAITSLVLGVLSLCCPVVLPGLAAIICGHLAHGRARKLPEQYGGAGLAIGGFVTGYASLLLTVVTIAIALPAVTQARKQVQRQVSKQGQNRIPTRPAPTDGASAVCVNNLKQITLGARIYSNDHNDTFPKDFLSITNELYSPRVLHCPADKSKTRTTNWADFSPARNLSYEFLTPEAAEKDVMDKPVFRCSIHGHFSKGDGSVQQSKGKGL